MKRLACMLFVGAALATLGSTTTQARPPSAMGRDDAPKMAAADSQVRAVRPRAPEVWRITVSERTRRSPQFQWGPWRVVKTFTGTYGDAMRKANKAADDIEKKGKNFQSNIDPKRIR
jgi:hypothetical protein